MAWQWRRRQWRQQKQSAAYRRRKRQPKIWRRKAAKGGAAAKIKRGAWRKSAVMAAAHGVIISKAESQHQWRITAAISWRENIGESGWRSYWRRGEKSA
jgi:hypothetical protein